MSFGLYRRGRPRVRVCGSTEENLPLNGPSHTNHTPSRDSPISVRFTWHGHSNSILAVLNELRGNRELSDIELIVGDVKIPAHKVVLSASSPYFRAMFTSSYTEITQSTVEMHGVTSEALECLMDYFYTSEINISTCNVQELFAAVCMLQITPVRDACCEFMRRHLGVSNCLGVRSFADMHSCPELKQIADDFARKNFSEVVSSEEFLKLPVEQVLELFSADNINVSSEENVFESVLAWIKHDPVDREKYIVDLLKKVRLPLLSPVYICDHARKVGVVERNPSAMWLLMDALECHLLPERKAGLSSEQTRPRTNLNKTQVILAVGGLGKREPTGTPSIEQYIPSSRQWRILSQMATGSWGAGLVTVDTEKCDEVYLVGGSNESSRLSSLSKFNVASEQWTSLAEMSVARNGVGVVFTNGLLYSVGGFDGVSPLKSAECYDPKSDQWTPLPDMSSKRFGLGACACEGLIYAVGGSDGSNLNTAECYNISTKSWTTLASMSIARKFPGVETLSGCVYAIGGSDTNPSMRRHSSVEKFIPSLNQWVTVASLLNPRSGLCSVTLGGYIYIIGGHDGTFPLSSVERYDPLLNEWTMQPPMSVGRDCASAAVVNVDLAGIVSLGPGGRGSPAMLGGSSSRTSPDNGAVSPASN